MQRDNNPKLPHLIQTMTEKDMDLDYQNQAFIGFVGVTEHDRSENNPKRNRIRS